jgi:DNA-nicking Smr family endonuclease
MTTRKPDRGRQKPPPVFTLRLTALPNVDAIRALRALLKTALRRGLRCVLVREDDGGRS